LLGKGNARLEGGKRNMLMRIPGKEKDMWKFFAGVKRKAARLQRTHLDRKKKKGGIRQRKKFLGYGKGKKRTPTTVRMPSKGTLGRRRRGAINASLRKGKVETILGREKIFEKRDSRRTKKRREGTKKRYARERGKVSVRSWEKEPAAKKEA